MKPDLAALLARRSEPEARAVLEDALLEQGRSLRSVLPPRTLGAGGYSDGDGYAGDGSDGDGGYGGGGYGGDDGYGGGDGGGYGGGYGNGGGDNDGYGGGDGGGYGGGYGNGGGDNDGYDYDGGDDGYGGGYGGGNGGGGYGGDETTVKMQEGDMREGLTIIAIPGGYYPYVLVGWLRRIEGDEWEVVGARVIRRFGRSQALAALAAHGPAKDTQLLEASEKPEIVHRLLVSRCIPCNAEAWAKHCPKPPEK